MQQKKQNANSEEKSPSNNKKSVENKEEREQNDFFDKEEGPEPSGNEEFHSECNEREEVEIINNSTKPSDKNQEEEKHEGNEDANITKKPLILDSNKVKSTKKKRKGKKTLKCCKKIRYKSFREHIKIMVKKEKNKKKENILSIYPLKSKKKIMDGNKDSNMPTIQIVLAEQSKKDRKDKNILKFYNKNKKENKNIKKKVKIFNILKDKKKFEIKDIISYRSPLDVKYTIMGDIPGLFDGSYSSFNSNGFPPSKIKKLHSNESPLDFNKKLAFYQNDDDERIKKDDIDKIRNMRTNHNRFYYDIFDIRFLKLYNSTNYTSK